MRSLIPLSLLLTIFDTPVHGIVFPFNVQFRNPNPPSALQRRSPIPINDIGNAQYVSNITVAGVTLPVLLDTGRLADYEAATFYRLTDTLILVLTYGSTSPILHLLQA